MNDQNTITGVLYFALIILGSLGNFLWSRRTKKKGTEESKAYTNTQVTDLETKITNLQAQINVLTAQIQIVTDQRQKAEAERDAAREENRALAEQLKEERENVVVMSKRLDEQESRVLTLEQQAAKNEAVKEAAQEIVKLIREGLAQYVAELTASKAVPETTAAVPTVAPEVNPT